MAQESLKEHRTQYDWIGAEPVMSEDTNFDWAGGEPRVVYDSTTGGGVSPAQYSGAIAHKLIAANII